MRGRLVNLGGSIALPVLLVGSALVGVVVATAWPARGIAQADAQQELYADAGWLGAATSVAIFNGSVWAGIGSTLWSWPEAQAAPVDNPSAEAHLFSGRVNDLLPVNDHLLVAVSGTGITQIAPENPEKMRRIDIPVFGGVRRLWNDASHQQVLAVTETGDVVALEDTPDSGVRWRYAPDAALGKVREVCATPSLGVLVLQQITGGVTVNTVVGIEVTSGGLKERGQRHSYMTGEAEVSLACGQAAADIVFGSMRVSLTSDQDGGIRESSRTQLLLPGGPISPTAMVASAVGLVIGFQDNLTERGGVCVIAPPAAPSCWSFLDVVEDVAVSENTVYIAVRAIGVYRVVGMGTSEPRLEAIVDVAGVAGDLSVKGRFIAAALRQAGVAILDTSNSDVQMSRARLTHELVEEAVSVREVFIVPPAGSSASAIGFVATGMDHVIHNTSVYTGTILLQPELVNHEANLLFSMPGFVDSDLVDNRLYMAVRFGSDGFFRREIGAQPRSDDQLIEGPISSPARWQGGFFLVQGRKVLTYTQSPSATQEILSLGSAIATDVTSSDDGATVVVADYLRHIHWYERGVSGTYRETGEVELPGQVSDLLYLGNEKVLAAVPLSPDGEGLTERGGLDIGNNISTRSDLYLLTQDMGGRLSNRRELAVPGTVMKMACANDPCQDVWAAAAHGGILRLRWRNRPEQSTPTALATQATPTPTLSLTPTTMHIRRYIPIALRAGSA